MNLQPGNRVLVNVAPFIGSMRRHKEWIPCEVLAVDGDRVHVRTEAPCRPVSLWVASHWIEEPSKPKRELLLNAR